MMRIAEVKVYEVVSVKGRGNMHLAHGVDNPGIDLTRLSGKVIRVGGIAYKVVSVECSSKNGVVLPDVGLVLIPWMVP